MRRRRGLGCALTLLIGGALGIVAADQVVGEGTSAAWGDQVTTTATATAGTWPSTPATTNVCVAYATDGAALTGCTVKAITYQGWGQRGSQTRNYYISFTVPSGARSVSFDVDLRTATGEGTAWTWAGAHVLPQPQFTARDGWTCASLPRVKGTGSDWHTTTVYFQVAERGVGDPCS